MDFFSNVIKITDKEYIEGLTNNTIPLYIYNLYKQSGKSILFVTSSLYEANKTFNLLSIYTNDVLFFPVDEFLTTKISTLSPELKNIRLNTLRELCEDQNKIVVTHTLGYLKYLEEKKETEKSIIKLIVNKEYKYDTLIEDLIKLGYERESLVSKTGEFAKRGYIIDIYAIGEANPIRIEFFDNTIESIRYFDINTQLSVKEINEVSIFSISEEDFSNETSIINYLNDHIVVFLDYNQIKNTYNKTKIEISEYNLLKNINDKYMFELEEVKPVLAKYIFKIENVVDYKKDLEKINIEEGIFYKGDFDKLKKDLTDALIQNKTVIICLNNEKQIKTLGDYIDFEFVFTSENKIYKNKVNVIKREIPSGFIYEDYIVISSFDIYDNNDASPNYKNNYKYGNKIKNVDKLSIGDFVVHYMHGVGIYNGIVTLIKSGYKKDYLKINYKGNDVLYIPVEKIDLISKYSSSDGYTPKINKLGGVEWEKLKSRVRTKVENIAKDLLKLYAKRQSQKGFAFPKDSEEQHTFEQEFIYTPTIDQLIATSQIKEDMEKEVPMDRLLCGDVGFGKTEVAFRAIFKAMLAGKQVALLCPTTILSNQHYLSALERFGMYPFNIRMLNRFVSKKNITATLEGLKRGSVDLLIGTHRILSNDINYKDLGLLIIDEEQRFGVKHKERIKELKNTVDVLSLSATPIPRTLQMSMSGIRNLSIIESAPADRYPVQTYVLEENEFIIKDSIYKELGRNGQVFILYNNVEKIEKKLHDIKKLIPEAKISFAHGRMSKTELENTMQAFINKEFDILLCTTIIETGIDIPSANTLIIFDADKFGLSQLYQIRGRVGRSNLIGYAYLMYKKDKLLSEVATKRLEAIKEFTELGSGFKIALRDLAIRGAGDILGSEQAGFVDTVGIELYLRMLNEEIDKLKGIVVEEKIDEKSLIEVETHISDDYVNDEDIKIEIHNMINSIDSYQNLINTKKQIEDRFGKVSEEMIIYMYQEFLEKIAKQTGVEKFNQNKNYIELVFNKEISENINGEDLFYTSHFINPNFNLQYKHNRIYVTLKLINLDKHWIYYFVDLLSSFDKYKKNKI